MLKALYHSVRKLLDDTSIESMEAALREFEIIALITYPLSARYDFFFVHTDRFIHSNIQDK